MQTDSKLMTSNQFVDINQNRNHYIKEVLL